MLQKEQLNTTDICTCKGHRKRGRYYFEEKGKKVGKKKTGTINFFSQKIKYKPDNQSPKL